MNIPDSIQAFQHPSYSLEQIYNHLKTYVRDDNEKKAVIVIANFALDFTVPITHQIALMEEMVGFVEISISLIGINCNYETALGKQEKVTPNWRHNYLKFFW